MATNLPKLIAHTVWANSEWITFVDSNFPLDEYLLTRLSHILLGEQAWFERIAGVTVDRDVWRTMTVPQLRQMQAEHTAIYQQLLADDLDRLTAYQRFTGEEYQSPVSDILLHLTLHGAHHRGQMATYVSKQGKPPINTDFIQYCLLHGI
jgi:uncharacterized damage-inducible protein DinB